MEPLPGHSYYMQEFRHRTKSIVRSLLAVRWLSRVTLTRFWRHRRHAERTFLGGALPSSGAMIMLKVETKGFDRRYTMNGPRRCMVVPVMLARDGEMRTGSFTCGEGLGLQADSGVQPIA